MTYCLWLGDFITALTMVGVDFRFHTPATLQRGMVRHGEVLMLTLNRSPLQFQIT